MAQTPTSKSAPINNAAKDDALDGSVDNTFTIANLLDNDPGGANKLAGHFFFGNLVDYEGYPAGSIGLDGKPTEAAQKAYLLSHGITFVGPLNDLTEFTIGVDATDIDYMVQIGNKGTWSSAHVDIVPDEPLPPPPEECPVGDILDNGNFEAIAQTPTDAGGTFAQYGYVSTLVDGWDNIAAVDHKIEVWDQAGMAQRTNGLAITGNAIETDGWGSEHLSPTGENTEDRFVADVDAEVGKDYIISFDYASRTDGPGGTSDGFDVLWNGALVGHFDPDASTAGWNTATIEVQGVLGTDKLEIVETGANDSYGALIDNIKVVGEMCGDPEVNPHVGGNLFTENFDETPLTVYGAPSGPVASGTIDLVKEGWTGTEHTDDFGTTSVSEVAFSGMFGPTVATSGDAFLDTQNTPGRINISHTFEDTTGPVGGKTAVLSFDIGVFDIDWGGGYQTNPNETFEFRIDGATVASFTASDFADATLHHYDIDISDYADNTDDIHTLSLVNTSDVASTIGFAVDSIQINDWVV